MSDKHKQLVLVVFDILGVRCQAALDSKEAAIVWLFECYEEDFFVPVMIIDETGKEMHAPDVLRLIRERVKLLVELAYLPC